jgi:hypothetical protein
MVVTVRAFEPGEPRAEVATREVLLHLPVHELGQRPGLRVQPPAQRGVASPDDATQPDIVRVAFFEGPAWLLTIRSRRDEHEARELHRSGQAKDQVVPLVTRVGRHPSPVERNDARDYWPFNLAWSRSTRCWRSSTAANARPRCFSDNAATST